MKKEDFIKLGLTEEQAEKCAKASGEELSQFVEKAKLDASDAEKKQLQDNIKERDKQLEELKKSGGDAKEFEEKIKAMQLENETKDKAHAEEIKSLRISTAVDAALVAAKAKNSTAVKALLDLKDAGISDDGTVKGLADQIKKLQEAEDSKFLFEPKDQKMQRKGATIGDPIDADDDPDPDDAVEFAKGLAKGAQTEASKEAQQYYFSE